MAGQRLIGDILSERRRSLGLSVERVIADTKLQRRMVEAFEDSDFDAMPPKGYAQASLASYARYLGLNPNEILRIYDDQLYDFQRQMSLGASHASRSQRVSRSSADDGRRARSMRYGSESTGQRDALGNYERDGQRRDLDRDRYGRTERDRRGRDDRVPINDRYDAGGRHGSAEYDDRVDRAGRGFDARRDFSDDRRGYASRSNARSSSTGRAVDRGLYESGYREPSRRSEAYRSDSQTSSRGYTRRAEYEGAPRDARDYEAPSDRRDGRGVRNRNDSQRDTRPRDGRRQSQARYDRQTFDSPERFRREAETVSLDDGYQGGSGGIDGDDRYQPRPAYNSGQRESLAEVVIGFWDSIRGDRRTFLIIVSTVVITLVVIIAVSISSCVRSNASSNDDGGGVIQVTPVGQGSQLSPWVDLSNVPAGSKIDLVVSAESTTAPWIEAFVDDDTYGEITAPGTSLSWVVNRSATIRMSSIDNVTVTVNGTPVVPVADNGVYVLTLTVADAS